MNRLPYATLSIPVFFALAFVAFLLPPSQGQRPSPSDFEVVDKDPDSNFVEVVGNGRARFLFKPDAVTRVEIYQPKRAPDRYPWFVCYVHFGAAQFRVDCKTLDDANRVADLIDRNTSR